MGEKAERNSKLYLSLYFCYERRQEVIDYVVDKYKSSHVAQIITFGTMAAKAAIRDVGRALGMSYQSVDRIAKMVPTELNITLDKALSSSKQLKNAYNTEEQSKELIDMARKLEGMPRHASTHAAGVVITREEVDFYVPLQKNDESIVTQFTMTTLEELGLLKMDFLGLRNLTIIHQCEQEIQKKNPLFSIEKIPMDDKAVYAMISQGDTSGVFQMESGGMIRVLTQLRPENIEDIIAVISLYRPGPMESIPRYIKNRHNPQKSTYKHPLLKSILEVTYGCIVYQEQVMQIFRELAGYSYGRADLVRRAMAKKKADVMEKERHHFIYGLKKENGEVECVGAVANGVDEATAEAIFNEMSSFAAYAFNKSHAAAYAYIAYQTAYLKCHYKKEYMAALLTNVLGNTDKVIEYSALCEAQGIHVLPPSINSSQSGFTVVGEHLSFGLLAIKNLGRAIIENIIQEREKNGSFTSLYDFITRLHGKDLNKRAVESLIKSGAFDSFTENRREMLTVYERMMEFIDASSRKNVAGQLDLFSTKGPDTPKFTIPKMDNFSLKERLALEKEVAGLYLSGHPLDGLKVPSHWNLTLISDILKQEDSAFQDGKEAKLLCGIQGKKQLRTRTNDLMAFLSLEDRSGSIEGIVFPNLYQSVFSLLEKDRILFITGKISVKEDEAPKLICEKIRDYQTELKIAEEKKITKLYLKFTSEEDPLIEKAIEILGKHPGNCQLYFYYSNTKKTVNLKNYGVNYSDSLIFSLKSVINDQNIAVK